jgi:uncharacterized membrane protein
VIINLFYNLKRKVNSNRSLKFKKMKTLIENLEPRTGSVYSYGWGTMKRYFLPLFLLLLIIAVIDIPIALIKDQPVHSFSENPTIEGWKVIMSDQLMQNYPAAVLLKIFAIAYVLFIINPISYGAKFVTLRAVRNENFDVKEVFFVFRNYLNVVLAALLTSSIVVIGFIFLIVPGIIFACRLAFVPYLVMDKNLDPVRAVEESWRLTKGYGWRIFWMAILAFFIAVAGIICLFFGIIFSVIWISASFAAMYQAIIQIKGEYIPLNLENGTEKTE